MIEKTKKKIDVVEQEFPEQTQTYNKLNINDVVRGLFSYFASEFKGTNISFIQNFDKNIPILNIEEPQIKEVVYNLISNATKAIQKQGKKKGEIVVSTGVITQGSKV